MMWIAALCCAAAVLLATSDPHRARLMRVASIDSAAPRVPVGVTATWPWSKPVKADAMRQAIVDVADAWAGELGAGRPPASALARALADGPPTLVAAADQVSMGADPTDVLLALSRRSGAEGARALAACWSVSAGAGAGSAAPARAVADGLRDDLAVRLELQAQVAAPRATARLVAALPLAGPLLGALIGANTVGVLTGTPWGRACLLVGLGLNAIGAWWVHRIVASAAPTR